MMLNEMAVMLHIIWKFMVQSYNISCFRAAETLSVRLGGPEKLGGLESFVQL